MSEQNRSVPSDDESQAQLILLGGMLRALVLTHSDPERLFIAFRRTTKATLARKHSPGFKKRYLELASALESQIVRN